MVHNLPVWPQAT